MVYPITDKKKIEKMGEYLLRQSLRNYMFYILGINLGLRVSDYLDKTVGYFRKACDSGRIVLRQEKTDKPVNFIMPEEIKKIVEMYIEGKPDNELMFPSRKGSDAITRFGVLAVLKAAAKEVGIKENIGCHSLRKTFGYFYYKRTKDIRTLMEIFNHSNEKVTLRYIGVTQEDIDNSLKGFAVGILDIKEIEKVKTSKIKEQ